MTKLDIKRFNKGDPVFFAYQSPAYANIPPCSVVEVGFFVEVSNNYLTVAERKLFIQGAEEPLFRTLRRVKLDKIIDLRTAHDKDNLYA